MKNLLSILLTFTAFFAFSQLTTITSGSQGNIQLPRLSFEQINSITNLKQGMMVFDRTFKCLKYYNGSKWLCSSQNEGTTYAVGFAWNHNLSSYMGSDRAISSYFDGNNNIYIVGYRGGGYITPLIAKYSATGNLIWQYEVTWLYNAERAASLISDNSNNTHAIST